MSSIDFDTVVIIHNDKLSGYIKMMDIRPNSSETKTLSVREFLDRVNEESIYYKTFAIIGDGFRIEQILNRQDFEDYLDNGKLDALVELYDEIYIDSIRYYTTEQLGKDMTVLLYN